MTPDKLTSWKEIAAVFGRDVRTVQRWEKEEQLPVHRHLHNQRSTVYAYREELEAWWNARPLLDDEPVVEAPPAGSRESRVTVATIVGLALCMTAVVLSRPSRTITPHAAGGPVSIHDVSWIGYSASYGDLNGDRHRDLVVTADVNRLVVFLGGRLPARGSLLESADVTITLAVNGDWSIVSLGDLNGDGLDDLAVGSLLRQPDAYDRTGDTYLLFGRREWPSRITVPEAADVRIAVPAPSDTRMAPVRRNTADLDRDGIDDLILGGQEYGPDDRRSAGGLLILRGRKHWPARVNAISDAAVVVTGARSGEGLALTDVGDIDGDGFLDLVARAGENTLFNLRGGAGRSYLFRGPLADRIDAASTFHVRIDGSRPAARSGAVRLADVDGDGHDDLLQATVGGDGQGAIRIWLASAKRAGVFSDSSADVVIGGGTGSWFGAAIDVADLDRDAVDDLIVSDGGSGSVVLLYGRRSWQRVGSWREHGGVTLIDGATTTVSADLVTDRRSDSPGAMVLLATDGRERPELGVLHGFSPYQHVRVDIRPGFDPNVVQVRDWPVIVRLFGSRTVTIDAATVRVEGIVPDDHVVRDFDQDGYDDVQVMVNSGVLKLSGRETQLTITGRALDGRPIAGADGVVIIPTALTK